jgi:uncharacterized pyridoxal phosphate-containing UPF0001 family protein
VCVRVKRTAAADNPDFTALRACADAYCAKYGVADADIDVSMGMSHDFVQAIRQGSTNVRIGSTIFGARAPKQSTL